jgi:hypothetical protein
MTDRDVRRLVCLNRDMCKIKGSTEDLLAIINSNNASGDNPFATINDLFNLSFVNGVVFDYNALPDPSLHNDNFYWAENAVTHVTFFITITDHPRGLYYSNGITWEATDIPIQASIIEVDAGANTIKYLTPYTFENAAKWGMKADTIHTHTPSEVGLSNVDNTSDLNKPISTATQTALDILEQDIYALTIIIG